MELINKHKRGIFSQELSHRFSNLRDVLDEVVIKSHMTKKTPHLFYRSRRQQLPSNLNLSLIYLDALIRNDMIQNYPFLSDQKAFFLV